MHNLERARGFLNTLQDEIKDPSKTGKGGPRIEWQTHTDKLDAHLEDLNKIISGLFTRKDS